MGLELGRYLTTARKDNSDGLVKPFFSATALSQHPFRPCLGCAWLVVVAPGVEVSCGVTFVSESPAQAEGFVCC